MPTITPDTLETFPVLPSWGFIATPTYRTKFAEREGGYERPNRQWDRPLLFISAAPLEKKVTDMESVLTFFHAMGGRATYFRIRDYSDYKSCSVRATAAATDQPLTATADDPGVYQLVKHYTAGSATQVREIYKPIGSTILVANELGVAQTDFTLDEGTGQLTPGGGFSGTPTTWGGEFDVEVRFVSDEFPLEVATFGTWNGRLGMRERRRDATT